MPTSPRLAALLLLTLAACSPSIPSQPVPPGEADVGILVMAHGGTPEWDRAIGASLGSLRERAPTVVAYGMADRGALQTAIDSLRGLGVERVAIVRMFISGASFLEQTEYFVGLSDVAPATFIGHAGHGGHGDAAQAHPTPIQHGLAVATHAEGLMGSLEATEILTERAAQLSHDPARESVILIAHGMATEADNREVRDAMEDAARVISRRGFADVEVATLREDWPAARVEEEARIRAYVESETAAGRTVLVLPYRLNGFGPYATVLEGQSYRAADALLPHPAVTRWVERTATQVACAQGWASPFGACRAQD